MKVTDYVVKVLGNDHEIYEVTDFIAQGKTHKDAIGIVFGTPLIGIRVLAFHSWKVRWGITGNLLTGEHDGASAVQIRCGRMASRCIYEIQKDYNEPTAITLCMEYQCGGLEWYLPSLMELGALYLLRDKINDIMRALKCDKDNLLVDGDYWSSTESSIAYAWYVYFNTGFFNYTYKCSGAVVRAIAVLSTSPCLSTDEQKRKPS